MLPLGVYIEIAILACRFTFIGTVLILPLGVWVYNFRGCVGLRQFLAVWVYISRDCINYSHWAYMHVSQL